MIRRSVGNVISVVVTFTKFCIMKIVLGGGFHFFPIERFSPDVVTEFNRGSKVSLGKEVRVHSGSIIKVRSNAELLIGAGTKINYNCIIVCRSKISIGEGTEFGPSVYVYDHDHDFRVGLKKGQMTNDSIKIGENCWIGANTIILKGTTIGANSVVGAGCVIKGYYPANSVITQKRDTVIRDIC